MVYAGLDRLLFWLIAVCIAIGVGLAFAVPWLWQLVKPLLHALTA